MKIDLTKEQVQTLLNLIDSVNWPGRDAEVVIALKQSLKTAEDPETNATE